MACNEEEHRRPDFVPGSPVQLADGQIWQLRRPLVRFVPDDSNDSGFQVRLTLAGTDQYPALIKEFESFNDGGDRAISQGDIAKTELAIGRLLLTSNYNLTSDQIADLLQIGFDEEDDPEGCAIRGAILRVAFGNGPKLAAGGEESPPTPSVG